MPDSELRETEKDLLQSQLTHRENQLKVLLALGEAFATKFDLAIQQRDTARTGANQFGFACLALGAAVGFLIGMVVNA